MRFKRKQEIIVDLFKTEGYKIIKYYFIIFFLIITFSSYAQERDCEVYYQTINNIKHYSISGYLEVVDNKMVSRKPSTINFDASYVIRPSDIFIKVYDIETKEEYYTRNFLYHYYKNHMYVGPEPRFVLDLHMISEINDIGIKNINGQYFMELYQSIIGNIELDDNFDESLGTIRPIIKIVNGDKILEFEIKFYRPKGKITSNVNNIFFQFESVEETKGDLIWGFYDLSNIDVLEQIQILREFFTSCERRFPNNENKYYIALLDKAECNVINSKNKDAFIYTDPFSIIPIFELFPEVSTNSEKNNIEQKNKKSSM